MERQDRRKKPRDTDRLQAAKERLDEVISDARWIRSQLDVIGYGPQDGSGKSQSAE